jgi:uridine kinase
MSELAEVLKRHLSRYPEMEIGDAVKLVYQNEFGGGHMIHNARASLDYLKAELSSLPVKAAEELVEDIGNGYARLNLAAAKGIFSPETLNAMFVESSNSGGGSVSSFIEKLGVLRGLCESGELPFDRASFDNYLTEYEKKRYPPVHHSESYRAAYAPAYRVISEWYVKYLGLISALDGALSKRHPVTVAIDGMSASGKSSLAALLAGVFDANVIHMDDFFLPAELRAPERLSEPGGNVHYERFLNEVVKNLEKGGAFSYRVFDCSKMDYAGEVLIAEKPLNIVEGAYSLRPEFRDVYDIKVFLALSPEEQKSRIIKRNGEEMYETFRDRWIPMENMYFEAMNIRGVCNFIYE